MYQESFTQHKETTLFQISRLNQRETLIVFFHGIGDSHLNFTCFFKTPQLQQYDLFIADLLGHGRSSAAKTYAFTAQVEALLAQLSPIIAAYKTVIFVPHSMGGIHATMLAAEDLAPQVSGIYAIETGITQYGSFVAKDACTAISEGEVFSVWFQSFCEKIYQRASSRNIIFQRYFAGLQFVREAAFLENAQEMYHLATALKDHVFTHKIGQLFSTLPIAKAYCLGDAGLAPPSVPFLLLHGIQIEYFQTDCHWVAQTCFKDFCSRLDRFIQTIITARVEQSAT